MLRPAPGGPGTEAVQSRAGSRSGADTPPRPGASRGRGFLTQRFNSARCLPAFPGDTPQTGGVTLPESARWDLEQLSQRPQGHPHLASPHQPALRPGPPPGGGPTGRAPSPPGSRPPAGPALLVNTGAGRLPGQERVPTHPISPTSPRRGESLISPLSPGGGAGRGCRRGTLGPLASPRSLPPRKRPRTSDPQWPPHCPAGGEVQGATGRKGSPWQRCPQPSQRPEHAGGRGHAPNPNTCHLEPPTPPHTSAPRAWDGAVLGAV